ncbi:MAG: oligosaccharide flippase family protein [Clostridium sp.]|uniref:lipopolysaccharide biosynthesis protein n=1 Tax=Clostridium sp. TaxID=1506 RepID=UPI0025B8A05C|nr:oligosaccharide flippase family protein [Clostridium sp.]MBS5927321.1 oligosaccharide flippase family protein [Clostridium sp.]
MNMIKAILKSEFYKNIMTLTSGALVAQIITLITAPILTRIFTPGELGVYTLILTAESLFGGIICGRYDVSIVSESEEKNVYPIIKLSVIIAIIFSFMASTGYGIYYFIVRKEYIKYSYAIIFIFFMLLFNGLIRIMESYNNRYKEYKLMTSVYVVRTSVQNFGTILSGVFSIGVFGMLSSHVLGMMYGLRRQANALKEHLPEIRKSTLSDMKYVMIKHYRQPIFSVPGVFANRYSYSSINLFVESLFGLTILGYYSISYKVLGLPLTVMSNNVAKVFYQQASREYDNSGKFVKSFIKTSSILFLIAVPMVLSMYYLVPPLFEILFGDGWSKSGVYVKILAPMFGIRFIVNTISYGLQVAKKQSVELVLQVLFIICSIGCYFVSRTYLLCIEDYLKLIAISFSIIYILYYLVVLKYAYGNSFIKKGDV